MPVIKPSDISAAQPIRAFGGDRNMEVAAARIVRFCQARSGNNWRAFTLAEIDAFCRKTEGNLFDFGGLALAEFAVGTAAGYVMSGDFIRRCYEASPA